MLLGYVNAQRQALLAESNIPLDNLYVFDGDGVYGEMLAAFSGSLSKTEIVAKSGKALVYFTSDLAFNLPGYNISYTHNACPYKCGGHGQCKRDGRCKCDKSYTPPYCQLQVCLDDMNGMRVSEVAEVVAIVTAVKS